MYTLCTEQRIRGVNRTPNVLPNGRTLGIKGVINPWFLMSGFFVFKNFMQRNLTTLEKNPLKCEILEKNNNNFNILAFFAVYMWGGKKYLSNYNWIASWMIWLCSGSCANNTSGKGAAGQELFRVRTQKVCQNRLVLAQNDDCQVSWCQKHKFLAHSPKSVWNGPVFR